MGWGQTVEIEQAFLNKQIADKKWSPEEMQERGRMWKIIKEKYPVLPFDTATRSLKVVKIIEFPGITKAQAYRRVKEWGSLNFADLESVIDYEDFESGKIILEGWRRIWFSNTTTNFWGNVRSFPDERRLLFSLVITIKDGKAKVEYENIKYKYIIPGYINTMNVYVPQQIFILPLVIAFPLVNSEPGTWEGAIDMMNSTLRAFNETGPEIEKYIRAVNEDYKF